MRDQSKAFFYIDQKNNNKKRNNNNNNNNNKQQQQQQTNKNNNNNNNHTHVKTYKWMIQILHISKAYYLTQEATIVWLQLQTWEHDCYSSL